jgi:mannose-6-phosphate isomerase-like protein (cupin superfamily)
MNTLIPEVHKKGWGFELWMVNNEKYCGKILHFDPNKKCSYHYHKKKHEHFYVLNGMFFLRTGLDDDYNKAEIITLFSGEVVEIPIGLRHQIESCQMGDIIEISTQHFEDDSYRVVAGDVLK